MFLIAEYASCSGMRIMCLDASFDEEVNIFIIMFSPSFVVWTITLLLRKVLRNKNSQASLQ